MGCEPPFFSSEERLPLQAGYDLFVYQGCYRGSLGAAPFHVGGYGYHRFLIRGDYAELAVEACHFVRFFPGVHQTPRP